MFHQHLQLDQWQTCFDTIWPFAFMDKDGNFLWAFAVVQLRACEVNVWWHFTEHDEQIVS